MPVVEGNVASVEDVDEVVSSSVLARNFQLLTFWIYKLLKW